MKKTIAILLLVTVLASCNFVKTVTKHCATETGTSPSGRVMFCAICDSTAGKEILNSLKRGE